MSFAGIRKTAALDPIYLCCYADLDWHTEFSVNKYLPFARWVDTSGDPYAYGEALKRRWTGDRDLIVIEQDIEITEQVFSRPCKRDWCVYAYQGPPHLGYLYRSLGCTRFSATLQRRVPWSTFVEHDMQWKYVDCRISRVLWSIMKIKPHVHGEVIHHNDYKPIFDQIKEDPGKVAWYRSLNKDGTYTPASRELQPDGKFFIYEVDTETGKRGKFIRKAHKDEAFNGTADLL